MSTLVSLHNAIFTRLDRAGDWLLPTLARYVFASTLLFYFWNSARTKVGDGLFGIFRPSDGAYVQIFPKAMEAVVYDTSQLGIFHWAVATAGMWAEFILPALIVIGLLTRLSSIAMIGFVAVQSLTDLYGHGGIAHSETLGVMFDRIADGAILDQRMFWTFVLIVLVVKGAGPLSVDRVLAHRAQPALA